MANTTCYDPPYLPASFKGVPVDAIEVSSEHGRRGAEGEFPFGETTAYGDLGRRIRTYSLSGRFVKNKHNEDARKFIAACESPGPGILVHPTRGVITAACKSCKVSDNLLEGIGETTVDCEFVEANEWVSGFAFGGIIGGVISTVAMVAAAFNSFDERYKPKKARYFKVDEITKKAQDATIVIRDQFIKATRNQIDSNIGRAIADFNTVIATPTIFTSTTETHKILDLGTKAVTAYTMGLSKTDAFRSIANWAAQDVVEIGIAGDSIDSLLSTVRIIAGAYYTEGAIEYEAETVAEGLTQRDIVLTILNAEAESARVRCDNNLFLALRLFITQADYILLQRALERPALVEYNFRGSTHSLVASYEIYTDAKKFTEIERRNPQNPPWAIQPKVVAATVNA